MCSAPLTTRCLIHLDHAARLVWDKRAVTVDGLLQISSNKFFLEPPPVGTGRVSVYRHSRCEGVIQMLVLTRKIGQEIVIGDNIRIKVVAIDGGKVRIGVVASKDVVVDRQEIYDRRKQWDGVPFSPTNLVGAV